jgi:putative membrane protein (TIGR04086 family)
MTEQDLKDINWFAAFAGFGVDLMFSLFVGSVVVAVLLTLKGASLDDAEGLPSDVNLAYQVIGVLGALAGGFVAGILARRRGGLHGVLASVIGLFVFFCSFAVVENPAFSVGDLGFIVLNLVAAGYAGAAGERFRARRESVD